jgi:hypothetical protein
MTTNPPQPQPENPALTALHQWELDTGRPASASEGNAFMDGYHAALPSEAVSGKPAEPTEAEQFYKANIGRFWGFGPGWAVWEFAEAYAASLRSPRPEPKFCPTCGIPMINVWQCLPCLANQAAAPLAEKPQP